MGNKKQRAWIYVPCPTCKDSNGRSTGRRGIRPCSLCKGKAQVRIPDESRRNNWAS